jgi:acetyl-CoA acetyltransferase
VSTPRFAARGKVAIAGYAHSPIVRHTGVSLGALTVDTCLHAIADAGLTKDQIDGFTTGALFPSSGARALVDGVHIVSAAWLVERLRVQPRWICEFQGIGQLPGAVILATEAIASGAADYVVVHRAMFNPAGGYHENPMTRAEGPAQWMAPQGFWGPPMQMALPYMEYMQATAPPARTWPRSSWRPAPTALPSRGRTGTACRSRWTTTSPPG